MAPQLEAPKPQAELEAQEIAVAEPWESAAQGFLGTGAAGAEEGTTVVEEVVPQRADLHIRKATFLLTRRLTPNVPRAAFSLFVFTGALLGKISAPQATTLGRTLFARYVRPDLTALITARLALLAPLVRIQRPQAHHRVPRVQAGPRFHAGFVHG